MSQGRRILVVDDEAGLRLTIAANLELEGFVVTEAGCGAEALEILRGAEVDLVLTDVKMPGMDGVELFRRIRELRPGVPVVLMSAFALEGLVQGALREGAFTLLTKPFAIDHLVAALTSATRGPLVLVVDDRGPQAEASASALRALGIKATAVEAAEQALAMVSSGEVDVCVVDMVMPGMDGAALIERIHQIDAKIVCIAVSGHDVKEMFRKVVAHVTAFLRKPVDPGDLAEAIARARGKWL